MRQLSWGGRVTESPGIAQEAVASSQRLLAALIVVLGSFLRLLPWLAHYPLHRDEALYGTWARLIASGTDPYLLTTWLDKPPLVLYTLAGSLSLFGASEWALRIPAMLASILALPLVYLLARRLYHSFAVSLLAVILMAASPAAILFAPTAFTDPWLALWLVAAAWAAVGTTDDGAKERKSERARWPETGFLAKGETEDLGETRFLSVRSPLLAGVFLGLAVASKQQGLLGIPLVIGLLAIPSRHTGSLGRRLLAALAGFLLIFGPVTWWDSLRWATRPSFWDRSLTTYGGLGIAPITSLPERIIDWAQQLGYLWGHPALTLLLLLPPSVVAVWELGLRRRTWRSARAAEAPAGAPRTWHIDLVLAAYVIGYLGIHVVVTLQVWDRYLLPLVPLIAILAARGLLHIWNRLARRRLPSLHLLYAAALSLLVAGAAWLGASGRVPVGGDHGAYAGLTRVVKVLRAQPADTIIYHQSLGWYLDYYLFDAPQERRWWDTAWRLADDAGSSALHEPDRPRWLVLTSEDAKSMGRTASALARRQLNLVRRERVWRPDGSLSFVLYQIVPAEVGHED